MAQTALELQIVDALEAVAADHGIDVVDVEVVGAKRAPIVRVRIDHADEDLPTISLDEVSAQSEWVNQVIDELDPIPDSFMLEISSPGMARPLRKRRDFERFAGQTVQLTTTATEGRRKFTGELGGIEGDVVRITCDGETHEIPFETVKTCKIKPSFDA